MKPLATQSNLVLGCGTGYSAEQLLPFVSSLRGTGYDGNLALVVDEAQARPLEELAGRFAVTLIPLAPRPRWLPAGAVARLQNRGRMRWIHAMLEAALPTAMRHPAAAAALGMRLRYFLHIACGRYGIYYSWLYPRRRAYANVLLTDVRDVIFQADPFSFTSGLGLDCFMDPVVCLGDEPINTEWMTTVYGAGVCAVHRGKRISCSGTTMGDTGSILHYLRAMLIGLSRVLTRITGLPGVDQAVHNFLLWEGRLPGAALHENGHHAVMTLKNADSRAFQWDAAGRLLNADGNPAPVLHQYDFHPALKPSTSSLHRAGANP